MAPGALLLADDVDVWESGAGDLIPVRVVSVEMCIEGLANPTFFLRDSRLSDEARKLPSRKRLVLAFVNRCSGKPLRSSAEKDRRGVSHEEQHDEESHEEPPSLPRSQTPPEPMNVAPTLSLRKDYSLDQNDKRSL